MGRLPHLDPLVGALLLAASLGAGCDTPTAGIQFEPVVGPSGGDFLTVEVLPEGGKVVAATELGVYVYDGNRQWKEQPGLGLDEGPAAATRALALDGSQLNYPRGELLTSWDGAVWVITRLDGEPALLWSDTTGARWEPIALPYAGQDEQEQLGPTAPATARAAEPPRLASTSDALYLVGTTDIWRFEGDRRAPAWESIGSDGLPTAAEGLPPAFRNYLPRAEHRPFELVTVLMDQLMVYRRMDPDDAWVLTSTLAVVDRQLLGVPGSETVFLIAPDSVQRSDDQGERWFRFWPEKRPRLEAVTIVPGEDFALGYKLLVGATDGSIWTSVDAGATWDNSREADPDGRAISGIAASSAGDVAWATTMGQGILRSNDVGETWTRVDAELRATRPLDLAFTAEGDLLLASRAGLHQLAGDPDSGNWVGVSSRATSSVHIEPVSGRIVSGTLTGDITTQAMEKEPVNVPNPFEDRAAFSFLPDWMSRTTIRPDAVVLIAARDDGQRWVAWSHHYGGVQSDDGGVTWRAVKLSDALRSALSSTTVTQLVVDPGDAMYLLEESPNSTTPALLWRTEDDGDSWTTVHAFGREHATDVTVRPRPPNYPGVLFAAHGDEFKRTLDGGASWESLPGPWKGQQIIDFAIEDDRAVLLVDARRHLEVVLATAIDSHAPESTRHVVMFSDEKRRPDPTGLGRVELVGRRVTLLTDHGVWMGTLPLGGGGIPEGMALLATVAGAIVLIAMAFGYMRAMLLR